MRKMYFLIFLSLFTAPIFADDSKPCSMIAKACVKAGYKEHKSEDKKFWNNCMKPVLLNKTVHGVTVDADTVKSCRSDKIEKLKKELAELENVS